MRVQLYLRLTCTPSLLYPHSSFTCVPYTLTSHTYTFPLIPTLFIHLCTLHTYVSHVHPPSYTHTLHSLVYLTHLRLTRTPSLLYPHSSFTCVPYTLTSHTYTLPLIPTLFIHLCTLHTYVSHVHPPPYTYTLHSLAYNVARVYNLLNAM